MFEMQDLEELAELCDTLDEFKSEVMGMCVKVKGSLDNRTQIFYDAVCEKIWQYKEKEQVVKVTT